MLLAYWDHTIVAVYIPKHNVNEVSSYIRKRPQKSSATNRISTLVLEDVADLVAPYIVHLFNTTISTGRFPSCFKHWSIMPIIKKAELDNEDVQSYRPISNLSAVLEHIVS